MMRVQRTNVRTADNLHFGIAKMLSSTAQVAGRRDGIVIEKINKFAARGAQRDVTLDGRLFAARDDDFHRSGG